MTIAEKVATEIKFAEIIIGIIISLIIASFLKIFLENLIFGTLGVDKTSTFQTFVVAMVLFLIFFVYITTIQFTARDVILGVTETDIDAGILNTQPVTVVIPAEECKKSKKTK